MINLGSFFLGYAVCFLIDKALDLLQAWIKATMQRRMIKAWEGDDE